MCSLALISSGLMPSKYKNLSFNIYLNRFLSYMKIGEKIAVIAYLCQTIDRLCCCCQLIIGYYFNNAYTLRCIFTSVNDLVANYSLKNNIKSFNFLFGHVLFLNHCLVAYVSNVNLCSFIYWTVFYVFLKYVSTNFLAKYCGLGVVFLSN